LTVAAGSDTIQLVGRWEVGQVGISHPLIEEGKMATIVKKADWKIVSDSIKPDDRRRVVLPNAIVAKGVRYRAYCNSRGQILFDPQVTVPLSEAWLFNNPIALELVKQGLEDVAQGRVSDVDLDAL